MKNYITWKLLYVLLIMVIIILIIDTFIESRIPYRCNTLDKNINKRCLYLDE